MGLTEKNESMFGGKKKKIQGYLESEKYSQRMKYVQNFPKW